MLIGYLEVFTCRSEVDVPPAGARHALSEKGGFCPLSLSYSGIIRVYIGQCGCIKGIYDAKHHDS
jgi:hypothetical protein